jgi:anthranilate/para-aminobenzoate synthase component I
MKFPNISKIRNIQFKTNKSPEEFYANFSKQKYSALLCGKGSKDNSRYAFIGLNPFLIEKTKKDSFNKFQELLDFYSVKKYKYPMNLWGGIGYMTYDTAHETEKLPNTVKDNLKMPHMQIAFYKDFIVFDLHKNKQFLIQIKLANDEFTDPDEILHSPPLKIKSFKAKGTLDCCSKENYIQKVNKIKHYIIEGDIYEVNLSHQCQISFFGDPYTIFKELYKINSAPFSAYLPFGEHTIICNSPERFLKVEKDRVETRPMKGTAPRGKTKKTDLKNKCDLFTSMKDAAELSMIVDLMRNDLGKVCEYGSVKVAEHKRIEAYANVWQMISIVKGKLKGNYGELLEACFPGGSITGCPKIRSMEIIDELEIYNRNLYTGSIFIANDMRMDSNIVIRSMIAHKNKLHFNIGGAVVYDSNPEKEYEETLDKAKSIVKALGITL